MPAVGPANRTRFGKHFQVCFCAFLLRDSIFVSKVSNSLKPEYFTDEALQRAVRIILGFYSANGTAPGVLIYNELDVLKEKNMLSVEMHSRLNIIFEELFSIDLQNSEYLLSEFDRFIRHQKIESYVPQLIDLHAAGKLDEVEDLVREMFEKPKKDILEVGSFFTADPRERIKRREAEQEECCWLLIPEIDSTVRGLGPGEVGILQSQKSSMGKTAALVLFSRQFLIQRKNVLYISLEEAKEAIEDRFDQCFGGITRAQLTDAELIEGGATRFLKRGKLWIAKFPDAGTRISDLRKYSEQLKARFNFEPDVYVIDYIDKLAPETLSLRGDLFAAGEEVANNWRAWMQEIRKPSWSATQSNRAAAEAGVADQQHTGRSLAKVQTVDVQMSINRTKKDGEDSRIVLYVVKNRTGLALVEISLESDFSRQLFWRWSTTNGSEVEAV